MTAGAEASKPTTSSMPASEGSAIVNPVAVMPTTISLAGMPGLLAVLAERLDGVDVPAQVSLSV